MVNFWKNIWKIIIITALILGIIYVAYEPIKSKIIPPATKFKSIETDLYEFEIPESWNLYEDKSKQKLTYSDLTDTSFIKGSATIYNLGGVTREGNLLDKQACEIESQQISDIIKDEKYFELKQIETLFDSNQKACISNAEIKYISSEDNFLEMQYHTYLSYQRDNNIIIFEITSPEQEFNKDLIKIIKSIKVY